MRYKFAEAMLQQMQQNKDIHFLTADLGFKIFDEVIHSFPDRAQTLGASEQLMLGMAVGLASSGKIPVVYSITPFLLYRPFEIIRNYIDHEKINVKLVGSGRDNDYSHDGFTHYAGDDAAILKSFKNITCIWPDKDAQMNEVVSKMVNSANPHYLNLAR
jgi:transketolase